MIYGHEVAAVIPARGGSKGIKKKNIREVAGKPLWIWSYLAALSAPHVDKIIVTTDMPEIKKHAEMLGCIVVDRPDELAHGTASLDETLLHAIDEAKFDGIMVTLQPTNPVRPEGLITECLRFSGLVGHSVLTVNELQFVWAYDEKLRFYQTNSSRTNRQQMDLTEKRYHEDGCCYVSRTDKFRETGCRVYDPVQPYVIAPSVNIDYETDIPIAEKLLEE